MRIVTVAGYHSTGTSAVTDFFTGFDNVCSIDDTEIRIAHDFGGISDLEYYLVENNHRNNTSIAVKRFVKLIDELNGKRINNGYKRYFGSEFIKASKEYVSEISELRTHSLCHQDIINRGKVFSSIDRLYNKVMNILHRSPKETGRRYSLIKKSEYGYFTSIDETVFIQATCKYTERLLKAFNQKNKEYVMLDQLVPPTNIERYRRYFFDPLYVIVVDRDPRDLYIQEKIFNWGVVPLDTVDDFCEWYRITRAHRKKEVVSKQTIFINFEDLVYKYEETSKKLIQFVEMKDDFSIEHSKFNPDYSIHNTNLVKQHPEYQKDIERIEKLLPEYLCRYF